MTRNPSNPTNLINPINPVMSTTVLMPQMGESIAEGTVVRWIKKVGDHVDRDEPLFEISTDKVDAEIPSPAAGVLSEIRVHEGETVAVNSVVATIGDSVRLRLRRGRPRLRLRRRKPRLGAAGSNPIERPAFAPIRRGKPKLFNRSKTPAERVRRRWSAALRRSTKSTSGPLPAPASAAG